MEYDMAEQINYCYNNQCYHDMTNYYNSLKETLTCRNNKVEAIISLRVQNSRVEFNTDVQKDVFSMALSATKHAVFIITTLCLVVNLFSSKSRRRENRFNRISVWLHLPSLVSMIYLCLWTYILHSKYYVIPFL